MTLNKNWARAVGYGKEGGLMIGTILGDIIGSRFEFAGERNKVEDFELFTKQSHFTDDTILTIATADAVLNHKSFKDAYQEWGRKYPYGGWGSMFYRWLLSKDPKPYKSFGNGSAMRVSPIGWLYNTEDEVMRKARKSAIVSHNHVEGAKGAQSVALCVYYARWQMSKRDIKSKIEAAYKYDLSRTLKDIRPEYKFDETCQGSVPESIICFLESSSFEDAVRKAVSLGGDTDTMGAIAGSIAEAYYGVPKELELKMREFLPDEMLVIVDQFKKTI